MTIERWLAFLGVLLAVVVTPGPDFAVVVRHALTGARRGAQAAAGIITGLSVHTGAAALGLAALVAARPGLLAGIKVAGAVYLLWLGLGALRSALRGGARGSDPAPPAPSARPFVDGLAGNLLNPKALLFFLGLLPQFVVPGPAVAEQIVVLAGTTLAVATLWWVLVIAVAARGRAALHRRNARRAIDAVTGTALLAVAVGVVTS